MAPHSRNSTRWPKLVRGGEIKIKTETPIVALKQRQQAWARSLGIALDRDGYCTSLERNFFQPPSVDCRSEFERADGSEFGKAGDRGKIQALHSSAALAINFFEYWRGKDLTVLAKALGIAGPLSGPPVFELKFPTGVGGFAPNIDVVLQRAGGGVVAIESKFTEPYTKRICYLKPKYFLRNCRLWADVKLSGCQAVAEDVRQKVLPFQYLDAAQVLKHMLGLARTVKPWKLYYLWYSLPGSESKQHQAELVEFSHRIGQDALKFESLTYQELFGHFTGLLGPEHEPYIAYLRSRYFCDATVYPTN